MLNATRAARAFFCLAALVLVIPTIILLLGGPRGALAVGIYAAFLLVCIGAGFRGVGRDLRGLAERLSALEDQDE